MTPYQDAPETKPTPAELWERAGYLRAVYDAAVDASAAAVDASAAAYAAAAASVDAYEAGRARWAREHPPTVAA